jgi:hypothetical protein
VYDDVRDGVCDYVCDHVGDRLRDAACATAGAAGGDCTGRLSRAIRIDWRVKSAQSVAGCATGVDEPRSQVSRTADSRTPGG